MSSSASAASASGATVRGACVITFADARVHQIGFHVTAQVAVRDDADEALAIVEDADAAETLRRNLHDGRRHFRAGATRGMRSPLCMTSRTR